ncbi:MAG: anthranilate synthase component I [Candidatus Altiarchaeota archaeon]|nr:anthranilate synthase component I [Candidatus Altiarchaeota archaeon]
MKVTPVPLEIKCRDPDAAYDAVRGRDTYLLESAEGGEKVARYSFIGFNPVAKLLVKDGKVKFEGLRKLKADGNPLSILRGLMDRFELTDGDSARFFGGFVGYFSYDLVRYFIELGGNVDDLKEPDCEFVLAKNNIIFDHKAGKTLLTQNEFGEFDREAVVGDLKDLSKSLDFKDRTRAGGNEVNVRSNLTKRDFQKAVRRALGYIRDGDVIQAVLSQRFETHFDGDSFGVFKNLKKINPSPYMYHLDFGGRKIVGSSPEMLARVEGRQVLTYPIAGTRRRGETGEEDKRLERDLLSDEKETAEHLMLVDLGRNDVGRVAKFGTVKVNKFMSVEKYSHVQHLVSEVEGELLRRKDEFDALQSIFPAGTVSGAPKVRAMEIIEELEPCKRGVYAGCVGYFSFNHNMDTAIAIRTLVMEGDTAYMQAGAGIVADSKPEKEYFETVSKAKGMLKALEGK